MPSNIIKSFAKRSGKSTKEVENLFKKAELEAKKMSMEDNFAYVVEILKTMLGLNESVEEITDKFVESDKNFDEFYETTIASDFDVTPETPMKKKKGDTDEEEEKPVNNIKIGLRVNR